jgi:peptidoglycan/xylan/chitin deacetylase (PgdA/CDA1 family)
LEGGEEYVVPVGTKYREPGFSAIDNVDGDLTGKVIVEGQTNWLVPGTYPITYTVTDAYENTTTVTRNVIMQPAERPETVYPEQKTIYLTFDDGPGPYTGKLLNILDKYQIKATFFVMDTGEYDLMKQIVERGHSIGIHTMTHNYREVYASPDAFFKDLYGMQDLIYEHTGVKTTLMRFPGGSSNEISIGICPGIMSTLTEAVQDAGFQFFDWNVLSGDAGDTTKTREVYNYVVNAASQLDVAVVLQHDIHSYSVAAVEDIILWGLENGYQFLPLQENSPGYHQLVAN